MGRRLRGGAFLKLLSRFLRNGETSWRQVEVRDIRHIRVVVDMMLGDTPRGCLERMYGTPHLYPTTLAAPKPTLPRDSGLIRTSGSIASITQLVSMTASPGDDIPMQLADLLGREVVDIRKTNETPPRISLIDVVQAITGQAKNNAGKTFERIKENYPEVSPEDSPKWRNYRFPGRGQRDTPVADVRGMVELIMLLPGAQAARVRRRAAELLVR